MTERKPRVKEPLTEREITNAARLLAVLLPMTFEERMSCLAIVCRALWDGRLDEPDFVSHEQKAAP